MNRKQYKKLNKQIKKIMWYSTYVDCFNRILNEFISNGADNLNPCDMPNLSELTTTYSKKLYRLVSKIKWEFEFNLK